MKFISTHLANVNDFFAIFLLFMLGNNITIASVQALQIKIAKINYIPL